MAARQWLKSLIQKGTTSPFAIEQKNSPPLKPSKTSDRTPQVDNTTNIYISNKKYKVFGQLQAMERAEC